MLKTLRIHCRRYEFYPGSGTEILHAAHAAKKKKMELGGNQVCALVAQECPTVCNSMGCSPPGSSV